MALMTLYRPDGEVIEYEGVTGVKTGAAGTLSFEHHPNPSAVKYKRIITSLPFLFEEDLP
jgi:hypothetical protein